MKDVGIIGLPYCGKTTLFKALTRAAVDAHGPATKPHQAVVSVPDPRLGVLSEMHHSRKVVPATLRFIDVAGFAKGSAAGDGLGAQLLGALREVDALAVVLKAFGPDADPAADLSDLRLELALADLSSFERGLERAARKAKSGDKQAKAEIELLERARGLLDAGTPLRAEKWDAQEMAVLKNYAPLTGKPAIYVINLDESEIASASERAEGIRPSLESGADVIALDAELEAEAAELPEEEARGLLAEYGVERGALDQIIASAYRLLDLVTFLTTGDDETRAWQVRKHAPAPEAAGVIHSDLQRGFIRAEVVSYDDLVATGGWDAAKAKGRLRVEGKTYVVKEGDVVHVRFAV
ncbi:MAG: redox-regulated ATPase YchF [Actinomycetota bacterium]